ncbi:Sua5/YciO/YrdC/YwlC family protein, partial [Vibrio parahaemolyticus]|nr:Sua5/YciO/YrdC/YwlC family protein [Vibrio parahaemolyticus]
MNNKASPVSNTIIAALKNNKVIAYPTEAVFGVGCDPDSEHAVM